MSRCIHVSKETLKQDIIHMWKLALILLTIASAPKPNVTEEKWMIMAKQFAKSVEKVNYKHTTTSYLHCFVFHYGYYLQHFGQIEGLGNYSIECNVKWMKTNLRLSTNGQGGRKGDIDCWRQLLQKHFRTQEKFKKDIAKVKESNKSWTCSLYSNYFGELDISFE